METRTCRTCNETKPYETGFYKSYRVCKVCTIKRVSARQTGIRKEPGLKRDRLLEGQRYAQVKLKYGLTREQHEALTEAAGGVCAICRLPPREGSLLATDHDHSSGVVRGMLCNAHNRGLGFFNDDPVLLRAAAAYLEAHGGRHA